MDEDALAMILEALEKADARAIVFTGGLRPSQAGKASARLYLADDIPHGWLFPRVSAVVHHGGAGTTAEGLRAGVPSIIIPGAADQYFWGKRVAILGAGPRPLTRRRLTAAALATAFLQARKDGRLRDGARRVGELIRAEDGVAAAVSALMPLLG
jgi:UDP:flavonoid glycosyltransferase YjiC (YdhE family)